MYTTVAYLFLSIILSLVMAIVISRLLYPWPWKKNSTGKPVAWSLFCFRVLVLTLLFLLLFNPGIRQLKTESQKPILAILKDNSQSMRYLNDSARLKRVDSLWEVGRRTLSGHYDIKSYTFAQDIKQGKHWDFSGKGTDLGYALQQINQSINEPIAATLLITDGNYNQGENPVFVSQNLPFPIYTIGVGDSLARSEVYLHQIYHNPVAYLNERTPVEVDLRSSGVAKDTAIELSIQKNGQVLSTKELTFKKGHKRQKINLYFSPKNTGLQQYKIKLGQQNYRTLYMSVKKQRQKVLLIYHAVHPDIGVIRKALENSNRFEPVLKQANQFNGKLTDYNMVLLHQVPSGNFSEDRWFAQVVEKKIPYWLILGPQSDFSTFNQGQNALDITGFNGEFEEASERYNKAFSWFRVESLLQRNIAFLPPLNVAFGDYKLNRGVELFMQNLHGVETERPAWIFTDQPYRFSVLAGTGLWKWSMYLYRQTASHQSLEDLVYKTVKFLSLNEPRKRLIIKHENFYNATQPIDIEATWYNENYEPDNSLPGHIEIIDSANNRFRYTFIPKEKRFEARPGVLPPGAYQFEAVIETEKRTFSDTGSFMVGQNNIERSSMTLNRQLLINMVGEHRYFDHNDIETLTALLLNEKQAPQIRKTEIRLTDLIEQNILLWIIVLLVVSEWIIRKFKGRI